MITTRAPDGANKTIIENAKYLGEKNTKSIFVAEEVTREKDIVT